MWWVGEGIGGEFDGFSDDLVEALAQAFADALEGEKGVHNGR